MTNISKLLKFSLLFIPLLVIGIGTLLYACKFAKNGTSNDPAVWGQFGDYINFWVSIASLIVVSILTYSIHRIEQERIQTQDSEIASRDEDQREFQAEIQDQRKNFEQALERPILTFKVDVKDQNNWVIVNVGKGAALNLVVTHSIDETNWQIAAKCYSLKSGDSLELWLVSAYRWGVVYNDIFENYYTATCLHDQTKVEDGNKLLPLPPSIYDRYDELISKKRLAGV